MNGGPMGRRSIGGLNLLALDPLDGVMLKLQTNLAWNVRLQAREQ